MLQTKFGIILKYPNPVLFLVQDSTCYKPLLKMKLSKHLIPSYGAFTALKRYSILCQVIYPQFITWTSVTWKPKLTPKPKLIPWFFMSMVLLVVNLSFIYIGFQQILAHSKDPEMSFTHIMLLMMATDGTVVASAAIMTYALEGDGMCFVLGNLQTLKTTEGTSTYK